MAVYADLVRYRELFANLFRRDFQAKYRGSALGVLWSLVNPLALMARLPARLRRDPRTRAPGIPHYPLYLLVRDRLLDLLRGLAADARRARWSTAPS